jgi:hypothetical protein
MRLWCGLPWGQAASVLSNSNVAFLEFFRKKELQTYVPSNPILCSFVLSSSRGESLILCDLIIKMFPNDLISNQNEVWRADHKKNAIMLTLLLFLLYAL